MSDEPFDAAGMTWPTPKGPLEIQGIWCEGELYVPATRIAELEGELEGHQEAHARLWEQHAARVVERDGALLDFQGRTRQLEKLEKHHEAVTAERDKLREQLDCSIEERFSFADKLAKLQGEPEVHSRDWWRDRASRAESSLNTLRELARAWVEEPELMMHKDALAAALREGE